MPLPRATTVNLCCLINSTSFCLPSLAALGLADQMHDAMVEQVAEFIEHGQLAAALEARIDGQHPAAAHRRLQQQIAQIPGEHLDGMRFGQIGQLAADFAFEAGQHQPRQRVAHAAAQKLGVRMLGRHEQFVGRLLHGLAVGLDLARAASWPFRRG